MTVCCPTRFPALILTRGLDPTRECMEMADKHDRTILRTPVQTSEFMSALISSLYNHLAPQITRSGVMMEIYGEGVLFQGESGVGKSEVAIELLKRGHRLIADDAVVIKMTNHKVLEASAPELIQGYMELRGIGVVDVSRLMGMGAIKMSQQIDLVVNLEPWDDNAVYDRFGLESTFTEIMGAKVPAVTIPVKPGRNLASIVEVAAMNNRNRKMGHNAAWSCPIEWTGIFRQLKKGENEMYYIGIDVGGTNLVAGLVNEKGHILDKVSHPVDKSMTAEELCHEVARLAQKVCEMGAVPYEEIEAVGVGLPGPGGQ